MHYQTVPAGPGVATILPDMDFETRSEAGFFWDEEDQKWYGPFGATKKNEKGLPGVGVANYAAHASTAVLCLCYDLKDGKGGRFWKPGLPNPTELFDYLAAFDPSERVSYSQAGLIEAHNVGFEFRIWNEVCVRLYGWPPIHLEQLRCSAAKSRAFSLPGGLAEVGEVLQIRHQKDPIGETLIKKFSVPQKPTKAKPQLWNDPETDPVDGPKLYAYCARDIVAEAEVSERVPDLPPMELDYWLADQRCNLRGLGVDRDSVLACVDVIAQCLSLYDGELARLTGGQVERASQAQRLIKWFKAQGFTPYNLDGKESTDEDAMSALLERDDLPPHVRRAAEIRGLTGLASVKKTRALARLITADARICDQFVYHGARTGRDTHRDAQPGNLPKAGPPIRWCDDPGCNRPYAHARSHCPWCGSDATFSRERFAPDTDKGWTYHAVDHALEVIRTRSLEAVEWFFGDALLTISGSVRGQLVAAEGHDLVCSDYSSIEAVVTACLSGEQWRIEAFRRREDIYLHGAAGITGRTYEWYMANGGKKHPDRQNLGKPGELGLGFGGYVGAWRQFGGEGTDDEVKARVMAWRAKSPRVVEMWGGQVRGRPWRPDKFELYGLEGAAIAAVQQPGQAFGHNGIWYQVHGDVLYCRLLSGRLLSYHRPRLTPSDRWEGQLSLSYEGVMGARKGQKGGKGWRRIPTYGGSLFENVVQATARDVMTHAVCNLERAGYPVVLRVHDEIASEVPHGFGSVEEFETIMATLPAWCADWPIRAAGGWRSVRYRKD